MTGILTLILDLLEKLGAFEYIKDKLLQAPSNILNEVINFLQEIEKVCDLINEMILDYLRLQIDPSTWEVQLDQLLQLEADPRMSKVAGASPIQSVLIKRYQKHLKSWFENKLSLSEQERITEFFQTYLLKEENIFSILEYVAQRISQEAKETRELLDTSQLEEAQRRITAFRTEIFPIRTKINTIKGQLMYIENMLSLHGATGSHTI